MTNINYQIVGEPYFVPCHNCEQSFDLVAAQWCDCDGTPRTLTCPQCARCFCRAGARYRERVWNGAPRALRENTNRFRLGDGGEAMPRLPSDSAPLQVPRVLVVDDEEDMRSLVSCYLEQMGYSVTAVGAPGEALAHLDATRFEVVITDALMPGMDGRELCQKIKGVYGQKVKVIVMTSLYTASRYKTEARFRFGADDYLAKPLRFAVLKAALDRVAPFPASA